jgi:hypothetical protein
MTKLLQFLSGKKGAIASVIMTIVAYLAVKGLLGEAEVVLIGSLTTIIFGGASYATARLVYGK